MARTLQLAWRNLGRNRRRTIITGLALAVGMSLCVASFGLTDGMNADILHALTRLDLGHVQVHEPDFPRQRALRLTLPEPGRIVAAARALPGVLGVTSRAYGYGLVSHDTRSAGVQLVGVDPRTEPRVTELDRTLTEGRYLSPSPTPWPRGRALTPRERAEDARITAEEERSALEEIEGLAPLAGERPAAPRATPAPETPAPAAERAWTRKLARELDPPPAFPPRVFLGASLAHILEVRPGDRIYITSQTVDGMATEVAFTVGGIYRTGTDQYDRMRIYLNLADLQRFLHLDGRIHEVALRARAASQAPVLAAALRRSLGGLKVLVRSWDVIRPDIKSMMQLNDVSTGLMVVIIFIVAALGVVNTMLMAVFERTRELGMLKAIGMSGARILWLVVVETTLLALAASAVGVALGLGADLYLVARGLDLSAITGGVSIGGMGLNPVVHGAVTLKGVLLPVVVLCLICFAAAFYPALRAARMRPAQGMREV